VTTVGVGIGDRTNRTAILGNNISSVGTGIQLNYYCDNCKISQNILTCANGNGGIFSSDNLVSNRTEINLNTITGSGNCGISAQGWKGGNISANVINGTFTKALSLKICNYTLFSNNTILGNNWVVIALDFCVGNRFLHNNFQSTATVSISTSLFQNVWDEGYPTGGNYWSNYTGIDRKRGTYQNITGSDGIGDTSVILDSFNIDHYPLMNPWPTIIKPLPCIADIDSMVMKADDNQAFFIYADPTRMTAAVAAYDVTAGGIVFGLTENMQRQCFDSNLQVVSQGSTSDKGRLLLENQTVLLFGGPNPHPCVKYLEDRRLTPVYFQSVSGSIISPNTHLLIKETSSGVTKVDCVPENTDFNHEDYFVLMSTVDANNNLVVICYGFNWKGTWAAGIYLKTVVDFLSVFSNPYYIFHWQDTNTDGIPQANEIAQTATG
jgi:hypothetical protein